MKRLNYLLNNDWLYMPKNLENGELTALDESAFERVQLPHANIILKRHKGEDFLTDIGSYRFVSWYRRHFRLTREQSMGRVSMEFEGVATVAAVYVNGKLAGEHKGGYTGFELDITELLNPAGEDNLIAVRVDSRRRPDVPPEGGNVDYCVFGGIVRNVRLHVYDSLNISDIFVTTPTISSGCSDAHIAAIVSNQSATDRTVSLVAKVKDSDGNICSSASEDITVEAGDSVEKTVICPGFDGARLWDTDSPNLYSAELTIYENGVETDSRTESFGYRYYSFSESENESKFHLNGRKLVIMGINRHEQWPWIGRAVNDNLQAADADLIKKSGINTVRCSHYPQSKAFLRRCDEVGLLVFEEAPGWQHIGDEAWQDIYLENVKEMILRDRNHPSIITWGVRVNESFDNHELYERSNKLARSLDSSRPTHGVRMAETYQSSEYQEDIFCANYSYPEKPRFTPFVITEHSWDWTSGDGFPWATDSKAVEFIRSFAEPMNYYYSNPLCAGGIGWSMFDYNNEVNYTRTGHVFYSGLYDIFRFEKPVANLYKAQVPASEHPMVYIANYWTEGSPRDITILTNCDEVELYVNGRLAGKALPEQYLSLPHPVFVAKGIELESGELRAIGYLEGKKAAEYVRKTPGSPASLVLTPERLSIEADGSDFTMVRAELTDRDGTVLPYASAELELSLAGCGKIISDERVMLEGGRAGFIVQSEYNKTGSITVTAKITGGEYGESVAPGRAEIMAEEPKSGCCLAGSMPDEKGEVLPAESVSLDIDDCVTCGNVNHFSYCGSWRSGGEKGCYLGGNHFTDCAGACCTLEFVGEGANIYSSHAPNHGICAISLDGGEETTVDCYSESRQDGRLLYSVSGLAKGTHKVKIRVTGEKCEKSEGTNINIDRAIIDA